MATQNHLLPVITTVFIKLAKDRYSLYKILEGIGNREHEFGKVSNIMIGTLRLRYLKLTVDVKFGPKRQFCLCIYHYGIATASRILVVIDPFNLLILSEGSMFSPF